MAWSSAWALAGILALAGLALLALPAGVLWLLRRPPRIGGSATPEGLGLAFEERRLEAPDGVELAAWVVAAREPSDTAVVVLHGYPASKADLLPSVAFLAGRHHLVLLDHRGLGDSDGRTTLGVREPLDALAGIEAALAIEGVERVALLGFSMGAAAALQVGDHPAVRAVVAEASYADLASMAPRAFPGLGPLAGPAGRLLLAYARWIGLDLDQARPVDAIRELDKPVLLVHGTDDATIPPEHARRLAAEGPLARLWTVEGAGHGGASLDPEYAERVGAFLDRHLD